MSRFSRLSFGHRTGPSLTMILALFLCRPVPGQESIWMPAFTYEKKTTWNETYAASLAASSITVPVAGDWFFIGPFDNTAGSGFDTAYAPEKEVNLDEAYEGKNGRLVRWKPGTTIVDGQVNDLAALVGEKENAVVYLYRTIYSPAAEEYVASLGSDDTLTVWLNGLKLLSKNVTRTAAPDQDRVTLPLREGENELLVKVCQRGDAWAFYFSMPTHIPSAVESPLLQRLIRDFPADPRVNAAYQRLFEIRRARWKDYALPELDVLGVNVKDFGAAGVAKPTNGTIDAGARVVTNVADTSTFQPGHGVYLWHYTPLDGLAVVDAGSADYVASVRVRPEPGDNPSEAGLAFRVADDKNYWALSAAFAAASAPSANVRLLRVRDGSATELRAKKVERPTSSTAAMALKVVLAGEKIRALVNDRAIFELADPFNVGATTTGLYQNARHFAGSPLFLEFRVDSRIKDDFSRPDNRYNLGSTPSGHRWTALAGRWGTVRGMAVRTEGATGESLRTIVIAVRKGEIELAEPWSGEDNALVEVFHDDTAAIERALNVVRPGQAAGPRRLIFPEGGYNVSSPIRLGANVRLAGLTAEKGVGASIRALPGFAPEYDNERFILDWQYADRREASGNVQQSIENLRLSAVYPETNPGLSGIHLATASRSHYADLAIEVPRRGLVVAEGSSASLFDTIDVRAGETCIDVCGRGTRSLTFHNIRLRLYDTGRDAVGLRIGPATAGIVGQSILCTALARPVLIQGGIDITLLGLNASAASEYPVVDVERARDDLSLMVSGVADGFLKAVDVAGETVAWVRSPGHTGTSSRSFRFIGGQSSLWMGETGGGGGQVNYFDPIRPGRQIFGGDSLVVDLIDTRTRGGGCATYEYVAGTGEPGGTVELGSLALLHNLSDFQLVRTVKGRVGPDAGKSLFTPDAEMHDGLLSLRVRADVPRDRSIWFNAVKTGLGLPGLLKSAARPSSPTAEPAHVWTRPGADGYIRDWLVIGPVPYKGDSTRGVLSVDDLNGESQASPRAGRHTVIRGESLFWRAIHSPAPIVDLTQAFHPGDWRDIEHSFGYMVAYIDAENDIPHLTLRLDFDDAVRIWLNGEEIKYDRDGEAVGGNGNPTYRLYDPAVGEKTLKYHGTQSDITLHKGQNTLVLKVCNETGRWAVGLRFKDLDGRPVTRYRIVTAPKVQ